jgi:cation diffusion facilitator family transporter
MSSSSHASPLRAVLYALFANFGIFVAKGVAAVLTSSSAMLAEAIHSLADCGNQGLLLVGMREAKRPPTPEHPLGYGKVAYFWAFLVSVMLFTVGGAFSVYEGWHKLAHPEPIRWPALAIGVLTAAIVLETFSLLGAIREIRKIARGRTLWRFFRESRNSELIVVLGEDIAALAGLAIALGSVLLVLLSGDPRFDAIGSMAVGVLLIVVAVLLAIEIKAMITGQSAEPYLLGEIRKLIEQRAEVAELLNLLTLQLGDVVMVAVKARMQGAGSAAALVDDINRVEAAVRAAFPEVGWMFFEPDVER